MKTSSFKHYTLNQAKRHQLTVGRFLGVDYSNQKFNVADGRAIDLKNYIYKDGVIQKRNGYEQILYIEDFSYIPASFVDPKAKLVDEVHDNYSDELSKRINNIWQFKAEDKQNHIVAHIGNLLYEIKEIDNDNIVAEPILTGYTATVGSAVLPLALEFENYSSKAFISDKMMFLGGNKYMCLRFLDDYMEFFAVEDSKYAPIPTTTVSITYTNSVVNQRMGLDNTNLLTQWRKNKLISGTTKNEDEKTKTTFYEYTLDAPLIYKDRKDLNKISVVIEERGAIE